MREYPDTAKERFRSLSFLSRSLSVDRDSLFHGPTSVMFDVSSERRRQRRGTTGPRTSEEWAKSRLIAESTKQRTSEVPSLLPVAKKRGNLAKVSMEAEARFRLIR